MSKRSWYALVPAWTALACYDTGPLMRPGENCMGCHTGGRAPRWEVAGTVFECARADRHEGVTGVEVVFRDGTGAEVLRLATNEAGNFYSKTDLPEGYRVSLIRGDDEREMSFSPPKGSCNSCHTLPPENGAPGRLHIGAVECEGPAAGDS